MMHCIGFVIENPLHAMRVHVLEYWARNRASARSHKLRHGATLISIRLHKPTQLSVRDRSLACSLTQQPTWERSIPNRNSRTLRQKFPCLVRDKFTLALKSKQLQTIKCQALQHPAKPCSYQQSSAMQAIQSGSGTVLILGLVFY